MAGSGQHNTEQLTRAVARGDRAALASFYESWFDRCYAAARRLTGRDEAFCLDVVQEAMLRVVRSIRPIASEGALASWMESVVRTAAIDLLRKESRRSARELHARGTGPEPPTLAAAAIGAEQTAWAADAVASLPEADRVLLTERVIRNGTLRDAGAVAGMSGDAAHGRIRRALTRLRALAKETFDD